MTCDELIEVSQKLFENHIRIENGSPSYAKALLSGHDFTIDVVKKAFQILSDKESTNGPRPENDLAG